MVTVDFLQRKKFLKLGIPLFLLFVLILVLLQIKNPQFFRKKAQEVLYTDEVITALDKRGNLQYEDGILATVEETEAYLSDKKNATKEYKEYKEDSEETAAQDTVSGAGGIGGGGEDSRLTLPSISAFSSNLQTGTSQVSYPIATFPGLGGLSPSLSLNYSSSSVDDIRLYQRNPGDDYLTQAGVAGLGWEIGGISYIARDNTTHPDSFFLVFPGGSAKLFQVGDEWSPVWQSNPKLFISIHHRPNNHYGYYDTNTWKITTQDGTVYTFGSPVNKDDGHPLYEALTPLTIAKDQPGSCDGDNHNQSFPYKWNLREVEDVNGNKIEYEYDRDWAETYYGACENQGFVTYTYLKKVKYNKKDGNYKTIVEFSYEDRPDYKTEDWLRYHRDNCKEAGRWSDSACNGWAGKIQFKVGYKRLKGIEVKVDGELARKYVLSYKQGQTGRYHPGHSLLEEIRQFGTDGQTSLPPYIFTYKEYGSPDDIYLETADNGYSGKVSYEYGRENIPFCTSDRNCTTNGEFGSYRYKISKITTDDGEGNSFEKTYSYLDPKAFVKTGIDTGSVDSCNACKAGCEDDMDCVNWCTGGHGDFCGYPNSFSGFEFLGFGEVTERLYALNDNGKTESAKKSYFYQALEKEGCFEPDAKQGMVYKEESLGSSGNVLTANEFFYEPVKTDNDCRSDRGLWENESVFVKQVQTNSLQIDPSIGSKVTASRTYYEDEFGLVTKVENLGEVRLTDSGNHREIQDVSGDETYSFTSYISNKDKWIVKPMEVYVSDDPAGNNKYQQTYYFYDNNESYVNPSDRVIKDKGLLTKQTLADDVTYGSPKRLRTNFEYYPNGQLKKTTDPKGGTTEAFYDAVIGVFPVTVKNALGQTTKTEYQGKDFLLGLPTITRDVADRVTKIDYDTFGRVTAVYNPSEENPQEAETTASVKYEYFDSLKKPYIRVYSRTIDDNYQVTDQIYNGLGQILQERILATFIDVNGEGVKEERGLITQTSYNSRGQKMEMSKPMIVEMKNTTVPPGRRAIEIPENQKITTSYDDLGRISIVRDSLDNTTRSEYKDFTTTIYDAAGHKTETSTDGLGRTILTNNFKGSFGSPSGKRVEVRTEYNVLGNPLRVTQSFPDSSALGPFVSTFRYDRLGRKLEADDPDLGKWTFEYDDKGRLIKQTDNRNQSISFEYDALDRLTKKEYSEKPYPQALRDYIEFKYDNASLNALGQKWKMEDLTGDTTWEYDKKGRVVKVTKNIDGNITSGKTESVTYAYTYYPTNQIETYKYPDGETLTYLYDKYGNQTGINGKENYLTDVVSNRFGSPTKVTLGNSFSQKFGYDRANRLSFLTVVNGSETLYQENYNIRDSLNNILRTTVDTPHGSQTYNYTYDNFSELVSVLGDMTSSYEYNEAGNITLKSEGATVNLTYDNNFPVHAPKTVDGFSYSYDRNGNLLEDEERTYEWNNDNKPLKVTLKENGKTTYFFYDGEGERVAKKEAAPSEQTIIYFPSYEKNLKTGEVNQYYSVGSSTIQRNIKNDDGKVIEKLYYLFPDYLSSTKLIVNKEKSRLSYLSYYPFGKLINVPETIQPEITNLYTGQKQDSETNLYYYHARYYNPKTGLFLSADKAQGPNRYAYVGNNPIMNNDPTGNECKNPNDETCNLIHAFLTKADAVYQQYSKQYKEPEMANYWVYPTERVDPKFSEINKVLKSVANETGIPVDVWLTIAWRENTLRGDKPELHGDLGRNSGDGLMAVAWLYHNLHKGTKMFEPTEEGWSSTFALHEDPDLVTEKMPLRFGKNDFEANIYLGVAVYLDALNRMTTSEYSDYVAYWREQGYSDYAIAYGLYNRGPNAILTDPYSESTKYPIDLFENTFVNNKPWQNEYFCPMGGWCAYPRGFEDPRADSSL